MSETLVFSSAALLSLVVWLVTYLFNRRMIEQKARLLSELDQLAKKRWEVESSLERFIPGKVVEAEGVAGFTLSPQLFRRFQEQISARLAASLSLSKEDARRELDSQIAEVRTRLAEVGSRFPKEAKLEKATSMNDALLSERIDQLAKHVEALEKRILSKWDVALIVSSLIMGIVFVAGATYTVLKVFGGIAP